MMLMECVYLDCFPIYPSATYSDTGLTVYEKFLKVDIGR